MRRMVRLLGLGAAALVTALLGAACGGAPIQVGVAAAPGQPTCESVCPMMASCPVKGPTCPQTCQAARNLSAEAQCEASRQAALDCFSGQSANICAASHGPCQVQTTALAACIANYCMHPRIGADTASWCLQAAAGF